MCTKYIVQDKICPKDWEKDVTNCMNFCVACSQGTVPDCIFVWYNFTYLCKTSWEKESEDVGDFINQCFDDLICAIEKTAILFNVAEQCKTAFEDQK